MARSQRLLPASIALRPDPEQSAPKGRRYDPPTVRRKGEAMRFAVVALAAVVACTAPGAFARGTSGSLSHSTPHSATDSHSRAVPGVAGDAHGKIARSPQALQQFKKANPCPGTGKTYGSCPGYVVDHVMPLKRGGADLPSNMQWQTKAEAKAKDRWE
jgi:hypothetical protein